MLHVTQNSFFTSITFFFCNNYIICMCHLFLYLLYTCVFLMMKVIYLKKKRILNTCFVKS